MILLPDSDDFRTSTTRNGRYAIALLIVAIRFSYLIVRIKLQTWGQLELGRVLKKQQ